MAVHPTLQKSSQPAAAILAALVACTTLLVTSGLSTWTNSFILVVLIAGLLVTLLSVYRLPPLLVTQWMLRLPLFAAIIWCNWDKFNDPQSWLFDTSDVSAFGMLAAAELVIQIVRHVPPGQDNGARICLLSGFVFLAACTTDQVWTIRLCSPLYFAFAVLSLPRFEASVRPRVRSGGALWRTAAVVTALAVGLIVSGLFWSFRVPLMQLGAGSWHGRTEFEATGISSQPTLEPTFGFRGSFRRVLRLENADGQTYLRGTSYSLYSHGRWGPSLPTRTFTPVPPVALEGSGVRVTTLAPVHGLLFLTLQTTGVAVPEEMALRQEPLGGTLRAHTPIPAPYTLLKGNVDMVSPARAWLAAPTHAQDLAVPDEIDPQVALLAHQIIHGAVSPAARAAAVQQYLLSHYHYSLTTNPGPGDPVSNFILQHKSAHCEFFGSAAVILLRCVGIPARYVTGYYAHESAGAHRIVVRQQDAHAWAEAWLDPGGWTTIDATPAEGRPSETAEDAPWGRRATEWIGDEVAALRSWLSQFTTGQILGALAALALLYGGLRHLWRRWRQPRNGTAGFSYAHTREMEMLAERFEKWLARNGDACPPERTWAEHVQRASLVEADPFVAHYNSARFGRADDLALIQALEVELQQLEQSSDRRVLRKV